jgi:oligogalacturonide lyase
MKAKISKLLFVLIQVASLVFLFTCTKSDIQKQTQQDEWIDPDTGHRVIRISLREGNNSSLYFHQDPFTFEGDKVVFTGSTKSGTAGFSFDMKTRQVQQITTINGSIGLEVVAPKSRQLIYISGSTVYASSIDSLTTRIVAHVPDYYQYGRGFTVNSDETMIVGCYAKGEETYYNTMDYDTWAVKIWEDRLPNALYTINLKTGEVKEFYHTRDWLGHVQFSPTDPTLLEFCHEANAEKEIERMWLIRTDGTELKQLYKYTIPSIPHEHVTHEFWNPDGKSMWFDLSFFPNYIPRYLGKVDIKTNETIKYEIPLQRSSWHYNISKDGTLFCGDGVKNIPSEHWIYLFRPEGNTMEIEKLCTMKDHSYTTAPNAHISPDGKWVIFQSDRNGSQQVYAVEVAPVSSATNK